MKISNHLQKIGMAMLFLLVTANHVLAEYDSNGVDLLGRYPYGYCTTAYTYGDYVCIANGTVMEILDVHTMNSVGQIVTESIISGLFVDSSFAYIANWSDGLKVVDISDVTNPTLVDSLVFEGQSWDVSVFGDYAYLGNDFQGLRIINVTDPTNINLASTFLSEIEAAFEYTQVVGDIAYTASTSGLFILDVSDPANPVELGYSPSENGSWHVHVVDTIAYLPEFTSGIRIVNTSNPENPAELGYFETLGSAHWIEVNNNHAFVSTAWAGLTVLDVSDLTAPVSMGVFDSDHTHTEAFHIKGDTLYLPDSRYGLKMLNISGSPNLVQFADHPTGGFAYEVYLSGDFAYVQYVNKGIGVFKIQNTVETDLINFIEMDNPYAIHGSGNYLYVTDNGNLHTIDIRIPELAGIVNTWYNGGISSVHSVGNTLFIGGYLNFQIIDVTNPLAPVVMGTIDNLTDSPVSIDVRGSYAYLVTRHDGLWIVNVADQYNPYLVSNYEAIDYAVSIDVAGNYAYVADRNPGLLKVIDISNPSSPFLTGSFFVGEYQARDVHASGRFAYMAAGWTGLRIIDCGNPFNPQEIGFFDTGGHAKSVFGANGNMCVSDGGGGIYTLQTEYHQITFEGSTLVTTTDDLDFGTVFINYPDTLELQFWNLGETPVELSECITDDPAFILDMASFQIAPGESQSLSIFFTPVVASNYTANLSFMSNDPLLPADTLTLRGVGLIPPEISLSVDSLSEALYSGDLALETFTINNSGGSDLIFSITERQNPEPLTLSGPEDHSEGSDDNSQHSRISFSLETGLIPQIIHTGNPSGLSFIPDPFEDYYNRTTREHSWELLVSDPDEQWVVEDIQYVYGSVEGDELLFKVETYYPWESSEDLLLYIFIDVDMNPFTGFEFNEDLLGIDILLINFPENNMAGVFEWYEDTDDFFQIGDLTTLAIEDDSETAILGTSIELIQNPGVIDFSIVLYGNGSEDFAPDEGLATFQLGIPWMSTSPTFGTIPAGESEEIEVSYNAGGLYGDDYAGSLTILNNDPDESEIHLPVHLNVTGAPNLIIENDTIDFGETFLNVSNQLPVVVWNNGTADLLITSATATPDEFSVSPAYAGVDPTESDTFMVSFTPLSLGDHTGSMILDSNDPNETTHMIVLEGTGVEPPVFTCDPDLFYVELLTNSTEMHVLTISNSGGSTLYWSTELDGIGVGEVTFTKADYVDWSLAENQDRITDNVWITRADQQGIFNAKLENSYDNESPEDTEWSYGLSADLEPFNYQNWRDAVYPPTSMVGQPLSLHLISEDKYFDLVFHSWTSRGGGGFSYTRTDVEPNWMFLSDESGVVPIDSTTNINLNFDASNMYGGDYYGNLIMRTNDPFEAVVNIPMHLNITGVPDIEIELAVYDETSTMSWTDSYATTNHEFLTQYPAIDDGTITVGVVGDFNAMHEYADIFIDDELLGTINPVTVQFSSQEYLLPAGDLNQYLADGIVSVRVVNSEGVGVSDEGNYHQVTLAYSGAQDSLDFREVFIGEVDTLNILIKNTGTDSLTVSSMNVDNNAFVLSTYNQRLNANESELVEITFHPNDVANYTGLVTLNSDDPDEEIIEIRVAGRGVEPPIMNVSPDSLFAELTNNDTVTQYLTISNSGASDLDFDISIDYLGSQESGDNYALHFNGFDGIVEIFDNGGSLNPINGITISTWIYLSEDTDCDENNNWRSILHKGGTCCVSQGYDILMEDDRSISWDVGTAGNAMRYASNQGLPIGEWTFLTCTYDAQTSEAKIFFNGQEISGSHGIGEFGSGSMVPSSSSLLINNAAYEYCPYFGRGGFPGIYDEVRIWDYARDESDIQSKMYVALDGDEPGLAGYWSFNEGTGQEVFDLSPNDNMGYLYGGSIRVPSSAPIKRWVMVPDRSGTISAGSNLAVEVQFNGLGSISEIYTAELTVDSNDPVNSSFTLPVTLDLEVVAADNEVALPTEFALHQNYPNPFNPVTTISYAVPEQSKISLTVFDIRGQEVINLLNKENPPGNYEIYWNGQDQSGFQVSTGLYFARLESGEFSQTIKMVYLK